MRTRVCNVSRRTSSRRLRIASLTPASGLSISTWVTFSVVKNWPGRTASGLLAPALRSKPCSEHGDLTFKNMYNTYVCNQQWNCAARTCGWGNWDRLIWHLGIIWGQAEPWCVWCTTNALMTGSNLNPIIYEGCQQKFQCNSCAWISVFKSYISLFYQHISWT